MTDLYSYLTQGMVKTGSNGERLLYLYGPWSRPYIIPDLQSERRVRRKVLCFLVFLLILITIVPQVFFDSPKYVGPHYNFAFLSILLFCLVFTWLATKIVFRYESGNFDRLQLRPPLSVFFDDMAKKSGYLVFGFHILICLGFIASGVFLLLNGPLPLLATFVIITFGILLAGVIYALSRKLRELT